MSREKPDVIVALANLCAKHDVKCLIQVGAQDGWEAASVKAQTGCRAIAIDAIPRAMACMSTLEFHHRIIGATDGNVTFYVNNEDDALSGSFSRGEDADETPVETVQQRLDTFCYLRDGLQPDALIIDTEGSTMEVLEGCGWQLLAGVKIIYAEVQTVELYPGVRTVDAVDEFLHRQGFTRHDDMPTYGIDANGYGLGDQHNQTWVRQ